MDVEAQKRAAAEQALQYVRDGMVVGLGTGSTAQYAVRGLAERAAHGMNVIGVPTSEKIARLALELGIPITTLEDHPQIDITIDGADEIDISTLCAIKGRGGALLREKIVALSSRLEVIVVDERKVASKFGFRVPLPVEVVPFGLGRTGDALAALGCEPKLRLLSDGKPYLTDSGNYLLDCRFPGIDDPPSLATSVKEITGVVEHGLFINIISRVIVARSGNIQIIDKA